MEPATHRRAERGPPYRGWSQAKTRTRKSGENSEVEAWLESRAEQGVEPRSLHGALPREGVLWRRDDEPSLLPEVAGSPGWPVTTDQLMFLVRSFTHSANVIGRP